jgi:hypothetical protein
MKIIALVFIFISACAPGPQSGTCRDHPSGTTRACTRQEQAMIDGMRGIISQIRNFDPQSFEKSFTGYNNIKESKVFWRKAY